MPKGELIDSHVSEHQCKLAVEALHSHETKKEQTRQEKELLPGKEQNVWLIVTVKKIQAHHKFKPIKMYVIVSALLYLMVLKCMGAQSYRPLFDRPEDNSCVLNHERPSATI